MLHRPYYHPGEIKVQLALAAAWASDQHLLFDRQDGVLL